MPREGCNICGGSLIPEADDLDPEDRARIESRREHCPECQSLLHQSMTKRILYNLDEIEEIIESIEQGTEAGTLNSSLRDPAKEKVMEQTSVLRDLLGLEDEKSEEAFERRNSVFIEAKFTYDRTKSNFPRAIAEAPVINSGTPGGGSAPWKLLQDEGETASTEGHSRAVLVVEIDPSVHRVSARDLMKLEGAIDGANGDYRNNCRISILGSAPEWFWEAKWGMNKKSELETAED